jgi:hypothetical protein
MARRAIKEHVSANWAYEERETMMSFIKQYLALFFFHIIQRIFFLLSVSFSALINW